MARRTITIDMETGTGKTLITITNDDWQVGRVSIFESDRSASESWEVHGAGGRKVHRYGDLETAFRNAIRSAVDVVTEDLLPTKGR